MARRHKEDDEVLSGVGPPPPGAEDVPVQGGEDAPLPDDLPDPDTEALNDPGDLLTGGAPANVAPAGGGRRREARSPFQGRIGYVSFDLDPNWLVWAHAWQARHRDIILPSRRTSIGLLDDGVLLLEYLRDVIGRDITEDDDRAPGERQYDWGAMFYETLGEMLRAQWEARAAQQFDAHLAQIKHTVTDYLQRSLAGQIGEVQLAQFLSVIGAIGSTHEEER